MRMRKSVLPLAWMAIVLGITTAWAENPFEEKLPFKSATITYEVSGMEQGGETVYIDDYGNRSAAYSETATSMMGMTIQNKTLEIVEGDWVYSFDLVEKVGVKSHNPMSYMKEEFDKLSGAEQDQVLKNRKLIGMSSMSGMGGKVEENAAEILGYQCDRVQAMGAIVYSLHGSSVVMKTESEMMGFKMQNVATAIDIGPVDEKYFAHPEDIEVEHDEEADAMSRQMAQQAIAWLKDPDAANKPLPMAEMGQSERMQYVPAEDQADMMKQMEEMMKGMQGAMPGAAGQ